MESKAFKDGDEKLIALQIEKIISNSLKHQEYFRLCTAGGSSPKKVLEELVQRENINWSQVVIYQTDERIINNTDHDSNYYWLEKIFSEVRVIKKPFFNEKDEESSKKEYEQYLTKFCNDDSCQFDLLILGFGEDGHIASLFPEEETNLGEYNKSVLHTKKKYKGYKRLSLSLSRLKDSKVTFLISYGIDKFKLIEDRKENDLPIFIFLNNQANVFWNYSI